MGMIKQPLEPMVSDHLAHIADDARETYLLCDGQVRLTAVGATRMCAEMQANFHTGVLETDVLGKAYVAGALLSSEVKGNDRIVLTVECGGPIGGYTVEAWACGAVRGYLKNNPIVLKKPLKDANLSLAYGPGFLTITKLLEGEKEPFTGQVMLEHGSLAKDLAVYYQQSEQTPSLFDLSMQFDPQGHPSGAGGLFFQLMPGAEERTIEKLELFAEHIKPVGAWLENGLGMDKYVEVNCEALKPVHLSTSAIGFSCPCSKDHFAAYLAKLPEATRADILQHGPFPLELTCVNCGTTYSFPKETLERLLNDPADKEKNA